MWKWIWHWVVGRGLKCFEVYSRKSLHCYGRTVKGNSGESSEREEERYREIFCILREDLCNHMQIGRNMDIKSDPDEMSDGDEECVIGNWKKGSHCYKMAKNIESCSCSSILERWNF